MAALRARAFRGGLAWLIALAAIPAARADYFECVDDAGRIYRSRQQLDERHPEFFSRCDFVREAQEEAAPDYRLNGGPPNGGPSPDAGTAARVTVAPATIVMPPPPRHRGHARRRTGALYGAAGQRAAAERAPARPDEATEKLIRQVAREYQLDPHLLTAIVHIESGFNPQAISPKGALGLMQVMPATAQRYGIAEPHTLLNDPAANLRAGAQYLRDLSRMFQNRLDLVLAAYNAGEHAVRRNRDRIPPFPETRSYVSAVKRAYDAYRSGGG